MCLETIGTNLRITCRGNLAIQIRKCFIELWEDRYMSINKLTSYENWNCFCQVTKENEILVAWNLKCTKMSTYE